MNPTESTPAPSRPPGIPVWIALAGFLALALIGAGALVFTIYYFKSDQLQLERRMQTQENDTKRHELEIKEGQEQARINQARAAQDQVLALVNGATNSLTQLLTDCETVRVEAAALLTNETGRLVALHPDLVVLSRRFYQSSLPDLPREPDIIARLEAVRRFGGQIQSERGKAADPSRNLLPDAQTATTWAEQCLVKLDRVRTDLNALVSEAKIKFTRATVTTDSPTLREAILRRSEQESAQRLEQSDKTVSVARDQAASATARAEADKVLADAKREADEIRARAREDAAAKKRELDAREAELILAAAKTKVAVETKIDEARKVELRKKAEGPEVKAMLAPFTTPGYWQVGPMTIDRKPLSYTALVNAGALAPDLGGLRKLVIVATTSSDKVRPRWHYNSQLFQRHNDQLECAKQAQSLLIELGPVLVDMGQLQP